MDGSHKHRAVTQETAVHVTCETKSQRLIQSVILTLLRTDICWLR